MMNFDQYISNISKERRRIIRNYLKTKEEEEEEEEEIEEAVKFNYATILEQKGENAIKKPIHFKPNEFDDIFEICK